MKVLVEFSIGVFVACGLILLVCATAMVCKIVYHVFKDGL